MVSSDKLITRMFRTIGLLSIFAIEAMAIAEALNLCYSFTPDKIIIFSDSKSVLSAVCNIEISDKINPHVIKYIQY